MKISAYHHVVLYSYISLTLKGLAKGESPNCGKSGGPEENPMTTFDYVVAIRDFFPSPSPSPWSHRYRHPLKIPHAFFYGSGLTALVRAELDSRDCEASIASYRLRCTLVPAGWVEAITTFAHVLRTLIAPANCISLLCFQKRMSPVFLCVSSHFHPLGSVFLSLVAFESWLRAVFLRHTPPLFLSFHNLPN